MREKVLNDSNPALYNIIRDRISQSPHQRITFAEYMDLVLYHPEHGYYATNQVNIGEQGDFVTAPYLAADFGELLAEQFVEMWEILGQPAPFHLVEMGAGQGILAADVLKYLHKHYFEFFEVLEYFIVEKAAGMIAEQKQILKKSKYTENLHWCNWEEIPDNSIIGCCFSNELVDALPVHQIIFLENRLQEIFVSLDKNNDFVEVAAKVSTEKITEYFNLVGINLASGAYQEGYRSEVNLAALDWIKTVANRLRRGYLLTIDYGYPAERYYSPLRRQGTLQCYYQHSHHNDPYKYIGRQDITAHVDFTALERQGELCGLKKLGFVQQGLFLMALGLGERVAAISNSETEDITSLLRRRDALHQLMNPMGLGGFGVLVQEKGLSEGERKRSLKGLKIPGMV
ncbi:MAG: class I SAM-dependent methyltransferase [Oscillatoriaceae bacterium SKW80]|nr:class I SAM-dependent methyltransferase [Oscillatoriaceae bacterium SKYG93]MCX8122074.1 class I SAM-dependent methyltransferase [Oscillatoriaceae bacterium SKW80]MDW8454361.1 class I SAM-dependent methyltransferase [Oscillatoriaceae cyanobacterium SKYGB_i_bin93]HIK29225.1 class I SAM-dependent methyltransferase [Oscillatoriaceae cyanobacterium M7585_C2015_266]